MACGLQILGSRTCMSDGYCVNVLGQSTAVREVHGVETWKSGLHVSGSGTRV